MQEPVINREEGLVFIPIGNGVGYDLKTISEVLKRNGYPATDKNLQTVAKGISGILIRNVENRLKEYSLEAISKIEYLLNT